MRRFRNVVFAVLVISLGAVSGAFAADLDAAVYHGGDGDGFATNIGANSTVVSISSAAAQTFLVGDATTAISAVTVTLEAAQAGGGITVANGIRIKIPASLNMTWDETDKSAVITGTASGKVSTTVSYESANKTLVVAVTSDFAAGDFITVSGLSFKSFTSVGIGWLALEIDNAGTTAATDGSKKTIGLPDSTATFTGGSGDGFGSETNIRYWAAAADGNWNAAANWSYESAGPGGSSVPASGYVVVFNGGSVKQCAVDTALVTVSDIIMESGYAGANAKLDANGNDITVSSALIIAGGELELDASSDLAVSGALTVSGGTLDGLNGSIDANGAATVSSGTLIAPSGNFNIAGNFTRSGGTFTHSNGTVILDGTNQTLAGSMTFYNLTKSVAAAATLTFDNTATQTVTHTLTLNGAAEQLLSLRTDSGVLQYNLTLQAGGVQSLSYLNVKDCDASGGVKLVAGATSTDAGNNLNWLFDGATVTWTGATSTDWSTASNWDLGLVPRATDTVAIADVANDPVLNAAVTVANLTINLNAILALNGKDLTVSSALTNNGTLRLLGSEVTVSIGVMDTSHGVVEYTGDGDGTAETFTIKDFGTPDYFNLLINDTHVVKDTFQTNSNLGAAGALNVTLGTLDISTNTNMLTTTGALTVDGGTLSAANGAIDANLSVTVSGGTLTAPSGNFNIAGDFAHTGGVFTHSNGTVIFDTAATSIISGSTIFRNLTCITAGKQLTFTQGTTQTIQGVLTLTGTSASKIKLRSSAATNAYTITDSGTEDVSFVDVQDSTATNSITAYNSTDSLRNTNWVFNDLSITYPATGKTTGLAPVVVGTAGAGEVVTIKIAGGVTVGTATADANGNFRATLTTALTEGARTLTPYVGVTAGLGVNITATTNPTTDQVPTITSPAAGAAVRGNKPTITGKGKAGQVITLTAKDDGGNLLLSDVATTNVDASGNYTIQEANYTASLPKGTNSIAVRVDGVVSGIIDISLVDPFGVVFDSVTNNPIQGAVITLYYDNDPGPGRNWIVAIPGVQIAAGDANPQTAGATGAYNYLCINGDYYISISAAGYDYPSVVTNLPAGRVIVGGSRGEIFTVAGVVVQMDHPMDPTGALLKIEKDANKKGVAIGDVVTYTVTIKSRASGDVTNVYLEDKIPAGFKYLKGKAILDRGLIADPTGSRPVVFNIGTIRAGQTRTLKYQLVVGSGVTFGKYKNSAFAKYLDGTVISNTASEIVRVVPDPLFDLGTVIGKVFWDGDENGVQTESSDKSMENESGISSVRIVMEDGTIVTTDTDGKYHIPGVIPGRHAFRLDESTLPDGAYMTTPKVVVVDVRQGLTSKVNFGVKSDAGNQKVEAGGQKLPVQILHEKGQPHPRLNTAINKDSLETEADGSLKDPAIFRVFTNYSLFIEKWRLDILDKDTGKVIKHFEGKRDDLIKPVIWDGKEDNGRSLSPDRNYSYALTVWDKQGKFDRTKERQFRISSYKEDAADKFEEIKKEALGEKEQEPDEAAFLLTEGKADNIDTRSIKLDGETVILKGGRFESDVKTVKTAPASVAGSARNDITVRIIKRQESGTEKMLGEAEYTFLDTESFERDMIIPRGEYTIRAEEISAGGKRAECSKNIKVGDDYFFFVAMGDGTVGYNFRKGNTEPVGDSDTFKNAIYAEGKLAYYLKAKIKGKYLITSSIDTERHSKELFKYIDPNKYYPIYGDNSTLSYDAVNTQGMLYALVEWDRSKAIWGNYEIALNDTEFAQFSRTLYGGKAELISASDTKFGEPHTKIIAFTAEAKQKTAHNEFLGTGGSLYYLKHKYVIEGSDKIKIEVRDKITGLVIGSIAQKEGSDYQIDYDQGRIIFWKPVSMVASSESIISRALLDGNKLYVIADYEYEVKDKYDEWSKGGRVSQAITDHLRVGGTYIVDDEQSKRNYVLKGADATFRLWEGAKIDAEYADSKSEEGNNFVSTDGGLTFNELSFADSKNGKAYGVKGAAKFFERIGLEGYWKNIDKAFSSPAVTANQGTEKTGVAAMFDLFPGTRLIGRQDIQKLKEDGNLQSQAQIGAKETKTTTIQAQSVLFKRLDLTAEYRYEEETGKIEEFEAETNSQSDTVAGRVGYKVTENTKLSMIHQESLKGEKNRQTTFGAEQKVTKDISLRASEIVGSKGNATQVGAVANVSDRLDLVSDYTLENRIDGGIARTASVGGRAKVDDNTSVYNTYAVTDSAEGAKRETVVVGTRRRLENGYEVTLAKEASQEEKRVMTAGSYGVAKDFGGRKVEATFKRQASAEPGISSLADIFGLTGNINDKWAGLFNFEKGDIQNLDGSATKRIAASGGVSYVDKDKIKASSKVEVRLDSSQQDVRQIFTYNAVEGKLNKDTTLFAKANIADTQNTSGGDDTVGVFKELVFGAAYRPVYCDRLNLIGKYSFIENNSPGSQSDFKDIDHVKAHVFGLETVYDLTESIQIVEKCAYKMGEEKVTGFDFTKTQTYLWVNRLNYNFDRDWQVGAEYRMLGVVQAEDVKQGALFEVSRRVGDFIRVGVGYNFTDFSDDLTSMDYTIHGPFVRVTATVFDRTPEEIDRAKKSALEKKIDGWAWELVNKELAKPDSRITKELHTYYYLARKFHEAGKYEKAMEIYDFITRAIRMMHEEAKDYVRARVRAEERLKDYDTAARDFYKKGRIEDAEKLWGRILSEAPAR